MSNFRPLAGFLALQVLLFAFCFRDALWGGSMLAPLDIAPTLFSKFRSLDPAATGSVANHHAIDQLTFDLPTQFLIYESLHRGEIPWWDPYNYGGWAMLADGHSNGTDWVRLATYALLPFEAAYNWTRILHFFLCGLGMFLLLRRLGFANWICLLLSVTYEFGGSLALFFEHPWIQGSFLFYPYLWLAWDGAFRSRRLSYTLGAALAVAGIFYSGSVQTHAYLPLFAAAFGIGYAGLRGGDWKKLLGPMTVSGLVGLCLAAPVLLNQIELFRLGERAVPLDPNRLSWLTGPASLTGFFPWCLGTFRTLDLGKFVGQKQIGFHIFIGSAAFFLAAVGACTRAESPERSAARRVALLLVAVYLVIVSTPLLHVFYMRCSTLASLGLIILAGHGVEKLAGGLQVRRRAGWALLGLSAAVAVALHVAVLGIYPRVLPKVRQLVEQRDKQGGSLDSAPALRRFQVENLPRELSFRNPAAFLAWLGLIALAGMLLRPQWRGREALWVGLLVLNLLPVLLFAQRYIPRQPMALWRSLLAGGPEQRKVAGQLGGSSLRLWESAVGSHEQVMPFALSHLYHVRVVHGYSSLKPWNLNGLSADEKARWRAQLADWVYETRTRDEEAGAFYTNATPGLARFQWQDDGVRRFSVEDGGLCSLRLHFGPGPAGKLLWTDSWYPGWQARLDGVAIRIEKHPPCFSVIPVPAGACEIKLKFRPRFLPLGLVLAGVGSLALGAMGFVECRRCIARRRGQAPR